MDNLHHIAFDQKGNPIYQVGPEHREADGVVRVYDAEGYIIPHIDAVYDGFLTPPESEPYTPDPDDERDAAAILEADRIRLVVRLAQAVVHAGHLACDFGQPIPEVLDAAIGELDAALTGLPIPANEPADEPEDREIPRDPWEGQLSDHEACCLHAGVPIG